MKDTTTKFAPLEMSLACDDIDEIYDDDVHDDDVNDLDIDVGIANTEHFVDDDDEQEAMTVATTASDKNRLRSRHLQRWKRRRRGLLRVVLIASGALLLVALAVITATSVQRSSREPPPMVFYTVATTDRSGSQLLGMMLAHSYAYMQKAFYGGACADVIDWDYKRAHYGENIQDKFDEREEEKLQLIKLLGLQDEFLFACPSDDNLRDGKARIIDRTEYADSHHDFTVEWVHYLRSKSTFVYDAVEPAASVAHAVMDQPLQVVVHLRRGDYTPCKLPDKYLPNEYYLSVLDEQLPHFCGSGSPTQPSCEVTVYTETRAFEPLDPFVERGYKMDYDSELEEIWRAFINADVLFISRSSFSYVPAVFNLKNVVYPIYHYPKMPDWTQVSDALWQTSEYAIQVLVDEQCS
jgi:hypothetical protein